MLKMMDRAGVARAVFASHLSLFDAERGSDLTAAVVRAHWDRFAGYLTFNPNYPRQAERAAGIADRPEFVGFKFLSDYHRQPITAPAYAPARAYADAHRLPILMHAWGNSPFNGPQLRAELAQRYPTARLLMGHAGYGEWDLAIAVARKHENVYLELCSAFRVGGVVGRLVAEVGAREIGARRRPGERLRRGAARADRAPPPAVQHDHPAAGAQPGRSLPATSGHERPPSRPRPGPRRAPGTPHARQAGGPFARRRCIRSAAPSTSPWVPPITQGRDLPSKTARDGIAAARPAGPLYCGGRPSRGCLERDVISSPPGDRRAGHTSSRQERDRCHSRTAP